MKNLRIIALIVPIVFVSTILSASQLSWDPSASGGASLGGSGNWDTSSALWWNGASDLAWVNANNDDAIFTNASGTVTLTENISAGNIYFTNVTGNYYITNATGAEVLTVGNAIDTGGGEHTIAAPISNSGTLNKNGDGRLHLPASDGLNTVMVNQGELSVENNNSVGGSIAVANGAAAEFNSGTNNLPLFQANVTISGSGITNSGSLRNRSGVTTDYGTITLGADSMIYADSGSAFVYDTLNGPLTDNGNNYNLTISGNGSGNVQFLLGGITIGGSLNVLNNCYVYLNNYTCNYKSSYVAPGVTLFVENNNGFGTPPASLMTTNCILDGGTISSGGTYTMYANTGITVTTNGGTLSCTSGTWTSGNIYSPSNVPVTFTGAGSHRPGGAAGTTLGTINLGTGALIKSGGGDMNMGYANPSLEIYSNLVLNGGSLSFNYDQSSGQVSSLGALPGSLNASNIVFNGGSMHVGHSTTIGATRGIYVASGGGTIEDVVSSGGTVTINSPISGPGNMNFPNGHSGTTSTIILAANNTYVGTTTLGASCNVTVGNGGATGTLGTGNTSDSSVLTFNRTGSYSYGGVISGSGIVNKSAAGIVTLTGANTYTGNTTISGGTLLVNNATGSGTGTGSVAVNSGGTLGGTGAVSGPVTVASGGTLALSTNTLTINNTLSLAGNVTVSLNKLAAQSNGVAVVSGALSGSGTISITVSNLGSALAVGDTFTLFNQGISGGPTFQVSGGGAGVTWNNNLAGNGTITVATVPAPSHPVINLVQISNGTNFIFSGTNGSGTYYVLSSTNLALPLSQWTYLSTNSFLGNGQFFVTNPMAPGNPQQFYLLKVQ